MPDVECTRCHGAGVVLDDRRGQSMRCSCMAGRQIAADNVTMSMVQIAALMKRKREVRS